MSTITRFVARNFQSHANSTIEPGPAGALTVLTGGSDEGKSALLRALKWAYYNQPHGDQFRRVGCDFVEVEVETEVGTIVRRRTATTNRYIVNGETFEGFGNTVPLEVQTVTGVRTVRLGDQEIMANLAGQLDAPFLGSSMSGPARAKVLGKLAGVEVMDKAMRDLNGDIHRIRTQTRHLEDEAERLKAEIDQYNHLPELAKRIEHLRTIAKRVREAEERRKMLSKHFDALAGIKMLHHAAAADLERWGRLPQAEAALERYTGLTERHRRVKRCLTQTIYIRQWENESRKTVERFSRVDKAADAADRTTWAMERKRKLQSISRRIQDGLRERHEVSVKMSCAEAAIRLEPIYTKVREAKERHTRLERIRSQLEILRQETQQATGQVELATQTVSQAMQVYETTLIEAGTCPTCGAPADHTHIKEVVNR